MFAVSYVDEMDPTLLLKPEQHAAVNLVDVDAEAGKGGRVYDLMEERRGGVVGEGLRGDGGWVGGVGGSGG